MTPPADIAAAVDLVRSPRATRLSLRLDAATGRLRLTLPRRAGEAEAWRFVARHAEWARRRLDALPARRPFVDGTALPVLDAELAIRHDPAFRGSAWRDGDALRVGGDPEFLPRRVRDWLKAEARRELAERARLKAAAVGRRVAAVSVRDVKSRWGSCAADGRLSFSWRLILAPERVLDYVVAHEVAHLVHMSHSAAFWALADGLCATPVEARTWLKTRGAELHRYG